MTKCPDNETLVLLLGDGLTAADAVAVERHVESCGPCRKRLEKLYQNSEISRWRREAGDLPGDAAIHLPPPASPQFIGRLAGFDIESVLGQGGMGIVYRARDSHLGRSVAIKVFFDFPGFRQIFDREARAAAAVKDDHVVTILHVVTQTPEFKQPFIVMELIQGGSLEDRLKRNLALPIRQAAVIAHGVALGLAATHARGLVHRDIKPSNIMLDKQSRRARITDFGLRARSNGSRGA